METKALESQSLFDISVQTGGSVESVFDSAIKNDISITDALVPGQDLIDPEPSNAQVKEYYKIKGLTPATGDIEVLDGISYMIVNYDFIVGKIK